MARSAPEPLLITLLRNFFFLVAALLPVAGRAQLTPPKNLAPEARLGINFSWWTSFHPEWVFVDAFKGASEWYPQRLVGGPWNTGESMSMRPDGYPASLNTDQAVACVMFKSLGSRYPGGRYACMWDGDGDVEVKEDAVIVSRSANRLEADVTPFDGFVLRITRTNPSNPVRNIRVVMPGHVATYTTQPFHPQFLRNWRQFKVVRFMDWMRTNGSPQVHWSDRPTPDLYSQATDRGVALEHMIDVSNTLDADPWFCFPHLATDDYVRQFCRMVAARLEPTRTVYLELSNECWNSSFEQSRHFGREGVRMQLSNDPFEAQLRAYSQRAVEMFRVARQELAATHRVKCVISGQNASEWIAQTMVDWRNAYREIDAVAVAPYFGNDLGDPSRQAQVAAMSINDVLAECARDIPASLANTARNAAMARQRGLLLLGYEGGQHLVGFGGTENNTAITNLFIATNRRTEMFWLYIGYLEGWKNAGGDLLLPYYSTGRPGRYGSWGALEYADQDPLTAPKYLALRAWIAGFRP